MMNNDMTDEENVVKKLNTSIKRLFLRLQENRCTISTSPGINGINSLVFMNWSDSFTQLGGNLDSCWGKA